MEKIKFTDQYLINIAAQFLGSTPILNIEPYGHGSINDSFKVNTLSNSYLLQRINGEYFPEPLKLLNNFKKISTCFGKYLSLSVIPIINSDELWYQDSARAYWRLYNFFDNSYSCSKIDNVYKSYEIAKAYGQYIKVLSSLSLDDLEMVVPDFHNTIYYYQQLISAIEIDSFNRVVSCQLEIEFVKKYLFEILDFSKLINSGAIPKRLTHNDTGIDNVLLDKNTGAAIAVIDLDTTMPGFSLYDFGDLFRASIGVDFNHQPSAPECFGSLLSGYLAGTGQLLTPIEITNFISAGKNISLELGIRFLTDYLNGDQVFKGSPGANLLSARKSFWRYKIITYHDKSLNEILDKILHVYLNTQ